MIAAFDDPSIPGIFIFGMIAGICPCNSAMCLGLIGYLTGGKTGLSSTTILKLVGAFSAGTIIVLLPLGVIAGLAGRYMLFLDSTIAYALGGVLMIAMGLQLLRVYKPPIKGIYHLFKLPSSYTILGTFLLGLSFGMMTAGRGAPMLIVVLTYIALHQAPLQGLVTMLIYAVGFSIPLVMIGSIGGAAGQKIKEIARIGGDIADRVLGCLIILIGIYFLYLAFA